MEQIIAVPVVDGRLSGHFGHCQHFVMARVVDGRVMDFKEEIPPPHAPGIIPRWLKEKDVDVVLVGGIGQKALALFREYNIEPVIGVSAKSPQELISDFLEGNLAAGVNQCTH
ncbi:MAG: NifB/NifX family molybdenum-iron cluster-binding protein [Marinilabilia sp.]